MKKLSLFCAVLVFAGLATLAGGCAGGCGEEPSSSSGGGDGGDKGGAGPTSHGSSGGEVAGMSENATAKPGDKGDQSRFDSGKKGSKKSALQQAVETANAEQTPHGPRFRDVALGDLPTTLKAQPTSRRTLVFERAPHCSACDLAEPAVAQTADIEWESYDFFRVDLGGVQLTTSTTLPIFLMYKGSTQSSQRAGLPFPRENTVDGLEAEPAYRKRLRRWLRDALIQKDLNFGKR